MLIYSFVTCSLLVACEDALVALSVDAVVVGRAALVVVARADLALQSTSWKLFRNARE